MKPLALELAKRITGESVTLTDTAVILQAGDNIARFTLGYAGRIDVVLGGAIEGTFEYGSIMGVVHTDALAALEAAGFDLGTAAERAQRAMDQRFGSATALGGGWFQTSTATYVVTTHLDGVTIETAHGGHYLP